MGAQEILMTIRGWMAGLRRAAFGTRLRAGLFGVVAAVLALTLFVTILEAVFRLPEEGRWILLGLWAVGSLAALGYGLLWPVAQCVLVPSSDERLASHYAERMPSIRDRVLNALQLLRRVDNREGYSVDLILEAGRDVAEDLKPINPRDLPDRKPVRLFGRAFLASGVLAALMFLIFGGPLISAGNRVLHADEEFAPPPPFTLSIEPGSCTVLRGDSLAVTVTATGNVPDEVILERLERGKVATEPVILRDHGENRFRYTYRGVATSFSYWAHAGRVETERYEVTVRELPAVRSLSVRLTAPAYTGLGEQLLEENIGDISALFGTTARLRIAATKPLKDASIEVFEGTSPLVSEEAREPSTTIPLDVAGFKASGELKIHKSGYYRIRLLDAEDLANRDPILYRVIARPDEVPVVSLVEPARDLDVAAGVLIPIVCEATDDFGFTRMALRYHRTSTFEPDTGATPLSSFEKMDLAYQYQGRAEIRSEYNWDLTPLDLLPEDQVEFFVEVWDNDALTGPKRAESVRRVLRFPSMQEIFDAQENAEKARRISLQDLLDRSRELGEEIDRTLEEYKSNPEMSWERKQELQQMIEEQQAMAQMLEDIAEALERSAEQMEARALFSPETLQKHAELQKLIQEVITPEMREALRKLQEAMEQANENQIRQAMENFSLTQEQFEAALDRMLNILKQLQVEQKMDEITRRLDELANRQENLNQCQESSSPKDADKLAAEQERLAEEMRDIEKQSAALEELMKEIPNTPKEEMADYNREMEQANLPQEMQQNAEGLSQCQASSCKKRGRKISRQLTGMANRMRNMKKQMVQQQLAEIRERLEKARDEILRLSERQEALWDDTKSLPSTSPQLPHVGEEQQDLSAALDRISSALAELAQRTLFVGPRISAAMWTASMKMNQVMGATQSRDPRTAAHYQRQAMAALNNALQEVNSSSSSCNSACNSASGMNEMCNKAGQMAGQQMSINQSTEPFLMDEGNPGVLSVGQQAALRRLAEQQGALAKAAEQLAAEAAASRQTLGRLGDVGKEMREIAQDLHDRNVTYRTRERQERIVSRLLDFQRSAREREFKPQRRAQTGVDVVRASPPPVSPEAGKDQLREDLLRALESKFARDYEVLIRQYFDALGKLNQK